MKKNIEENDFLTFDYFMKNKNKNKNKISSFIFINYLKIIKYT